MRFRGPIGADFGRAAEIITSRGSLYRIFPRGQPADTIPAVLIGDIGITASRAPRLYVHVFQWFAIGIGHAPGQSAGWHQLKIDARFVVVRLEHDGNAFST